MTFAKIRACDNCDCTLEQCHLGTKFNKPTHRTFACWQATAQKLSVYFVYYLATALFCFFFFLRIKLRSPAET